MTPKEIALECLQQFKVEIIEDWILNLDIKVNLSNPLRDQIGNCLSEMVNNFGEAFSQEDLLELVGEYGEPMIDVPIEVTDTCSLQAAINLMGSSVTGLAAATEFTRLLDLIVHFDRGDVFGGLGSEDFDEEGMDSDNIRNGVSKEYLEELVYKVVEE